MVPTSNKGETPLPLARYWGHLDVVRLQSEIRRLDTSPRYQAERRPSLIVMGSVCSCDHLYQGRSFPAATPLFHRKGYMVPETDVLPELSMSITRNSLSFQVHGLLHAFLLASCRPDTKRSVRQLPIVTVVVKVVIIVAVVVIIRHPFFHHPQSGHYFSRARGLPVPNPHGEVFQKSLTAVSTKPSTLRLSPISPL